MFLAENDHNHRPPCLISKSDSATHVLSFSGVVIAAQVRLQWTQCKSSHKCAKSNAFPW